MKDSLAIALGFVAVIVFAGIMKDELYWWLIKRTPRPNLLMIPLCALVAIAASYMMTDAAYRTDTQQEETTPNPPETPDSWPTETPWPECGWKDWVDVVLTNDEQHLHRIEALEATVTAMQQPASTVTPTRVETPTPTSTVQAILCRRCEYESDCGPGYTCYRGSDMRSRCVRKDFRNGDSQNCINAGR